MSVRVTTTVVVQPTTNDLVTLANLKIDLGIAAGDTSDDVFLARAISRASAAVLQYCDRVFAIQTLKDVFDLSFARLQFGGESVLQSSSWPVASIVSLLEGTTALVQDTDFRVDVKTGQFFRLNSSGFDTSWSLSPVTLNYTAGYATIPLDLQGAISSIVSGLKFSKTRDPLLRSENILSGLYAYTLFDPSAVPAGTAEQVGVVLDNYRVPVMA